MGADEVLPLRSDHEGVLTGVESKNLARRKKAIARRRLYPPSKGPGYQNPPIPVLIGAALFCSRLLSRVLLWLLCGNFKFVSSFDLSVPCFLFIDQFLLPQAKTMPVTSTCFFVGQYIKRRSLRYWIFSIAISSFP